MSVVDDLKSVIGGYIANLTSLKESLPLYEVVGHAVAKQYGEELRDFVEKYCTKLEDSDEDKNKINIDYAHYREYKNRKLKFDNIGIASRLLPRNVLVSMVSQYDAFLRRLLIALYRQKPILVNQSEKSFKYSEIAKFDSIQDFRDQVIEKVAEACIRESHDEQFKIIANAFDVKLDKNLPVFPTFIEICERRNLFVHCDGAVSQQYLEVGRRIGYDVSAAKLGKKLSCDHAYISMAYETLIEIGIKLAFVLWKKTFPQEDASADSYFSEITFEFIANENYKIAEVLLSSALDMWDKKFSSEEYKVISQVNLAQTYKWLERKEDCINILDSRNWNVLDSKYRLANAVLRTEWSNALKLMEVVANSNGIQAVDYRDWPLFKEFVQIEGFPEAFQRIYAKSFDSLLYDFEDKSKGKKKVFSLEVNERGAGNKKSKEK